MTLTRFALLFLYRGPCELVVGVKGEGDEDCEAADRREGVDAVGLALM